MKNIRDWLWFLTVINILIASERSSDKISSGFEFKIEDRSFKYVNPGFELKEIDKDGVNYIKPEMVGSGSKALPGEPDLPSTSTFYAVDPGKTYSVNISIQEYEIIENVENIASIPQIQELNIGHFLIGESVFCGLEETINKMKKLIEVSRK